MLGSTWYLHVAAFPQGWTWTAVNFVIPAGGNNETPTVTPAALVNPNRDSIPTQEHAIGHVAYFLAHFLNGTPSVAWQFRVPAGSNTWHTFKTSTPVSGYIAIDTILEAVFIPCVPQFRLYFSNSGGVDCTVEGALTLYTM